MKRLSSLIICIIVLAITLIFSPVIMAAREAKEELSKPNGAFGFGFSLIGGSGVAYKQFINSNTNLQYAGAIAGSSDNYINYNFGVMYQKILHENEKTRLLFSPGISWMQIVDLNEDNNVSEFETNYFLNKEDEKRLSAGITFGIEWKFDKVSLGVFTGYQGSKYYSYDTDFNYSSKEDALAEEMESIFEFGPTGGLSLFYYF